MQNNNSKTLVSWVVVIIAFVAGYFLLQVSTQPRWVKYENGLLGVSFMYPEDGEVVWSEDVSGANGIAAYQFSIGGESQISVAAVQKGFFGGEPDYLSSLVSSDFTNCNAYRFITKSGLTGYRLLSAENDANPCASVQGMVAGGYLVYVFDLGTMEGARIGFIVPEFGQAFAEKLLDTLEIKNNYVLYENEWFSFKHDASLSVVKLEGIDDADRPVVLGVGIKDGLYYPIEISYTVTSGFVSEQDPSLLPTNIVIHDRKIFGKNNFGVFFDNVQQRINYELYKDGYGLVISIPAGPDNQTPLGVDMTSFTFK